MHLLAILNVRIEHSGTPPEAGMIVMNHISWLDVIVLNSLAPSRFVAKAEVARWPLVGYLCTMGGTLYIERNRKAAARRTNEVIAGALLRGERVAVFPEGTTTVGDRVLRFHAALLQPAIATAGMVHPVSVQYFDSLLRRSADVSYVGDETLFDSVWKLLGAIYVVARVDFGAPHAAHGMHRRALADGLHQSISRALLDGTPNMEPETSARLQA